jgi:predicted amidohydrolase
MSSPIKLGLVQPRTYWGDEEPRNLHEARRYVAQAAALGVDLLAFPENYPGRTAATDASRSSSRCAQRRPSTAWPSR